MMQAEGIWTCSGAIHDPCWLPVHLHVLARVSRTAQVKTLTLFVTARLAVATGIGAVQLMTFPKQRP